MKTFEERFWTKVKKTESCWIWIAGKFGTGYGLFVVAFHPQRNEHAHRTAYKLCGGVIPHGFDLDHLCRNKLCVNPSHLEPVTRKENLLRGLTVPAYNSDKRFCPRGHLYDQVIIDRGYSKRRCRVCKNASNRRYWSRCQRKFL